MKIFWRYFSGLFFLLSVFFVFLFWPLSVFTFLLALIGLTGIDACNRWETDGVIYPIPHQGRRMDFGPEGPPWADQEPPVTIGERTIFAGAIRSITEWEAMGPDIEVTGGVRKARPNTARPACVEVILHTGDHFQATGPVAERLRKWFDDYGN